MSIHSICFHAKTKKKIFIWIRYLSEAIFSLWLLISFLTVKKKPQFSDDIEQVRQKILIAYAYSISPEWHENQWSQCSAIKFYKSHDPVNGSE